MADIVYADGTLTTGSNNGTSWTDAYQGATGLQSAIDAHNGGNETHIFIRNTFTLAAGIDIDKARTGYADNKWLRIIGCDSNGDVLPLGEYVDFDMNNDSGVAYGFKIDSTSWCTEVRNVRCHNGYTGKYGISLRGATSSKYNYILNNVKTEDVDYGIWAGTTYAYDERLSNFIILNCHIEGDVQATKSNTTRWLLQYVQNSLFKNNNTSYPVVSDVRTGYGVWAKCIFIGGTHALHNSFATGPVCYGCIFYNQATTAIHHQAMSGNSINVVLNNCIFWLTSASSPVIVLDTGGNVGNVEYNASNSTHSNKWGTNTPDPVNTKLLTSSPFVDAANNDFRLKLGSGLINSGLPMQNGTGIDGFSSIGVWQRKVEIITKAKTANFGRMAIIR